MDYLEEIFYKIEVESVPDTPEAKELWHVWELLMGDIKEAMGVKMADKVHDAFSGYVTLESYRYFREGVRLGLELLRL